MKIISLLLALLTFTSCASFRPGGDESENAPKARTELGAGAAAIYVKQKGAWHQLRIEVDANAPKLRDRSYAFYPKAISSVWRYNSSTGDYDIRVSPRTTGARLIASLYFEGRDNQLKIRSGGGSHFTGGNVGLPDHNYTEIAIMIEPGSHVGSVEIEEGTQLRATATATMKPTPSEASRGIGDRTVKVWKSWEVKTLPGRKAEFVEVTER